MAELSVSTRYRVINGTRVTLVYGDGDEVVIQEGGGPELYFTPEAAALLGTAIEGVIFDINEKHPQEG